MVHSGGSDPPRKPPHSAAPTRSGGSDPPYIPGMHGAGGWVRGAAATIIVGASFPVSQALVGFPYATGQLLRYALGAAILTALLKGRLGRPGGRDFVRLAAVAAVGMVGFNLAVLAAVARIGATNVGVIVGASPVLLARKDLRPALIVVAGAVLVNGVDSRLSAAGLALAVAALAGEVGFTLLT